jgi:transposase
LLVCRGHDVDASLGQAGQCCRLSDYHRSRQVRVDRYPSDMTDAEWAQLDPLLPDPAPLVDRAGGRPEEHCRRDIVNGIYYVVDNGIKWRAMPVDFPPWRTVYNYFDAWDKSGITERCLDMLRDRLRLREGRAVTPSAGVVDSASVKAAETVGANTRGFDAGKKINGRKRHIVVDTLGLVLVVMVTAASVQDRDAAKPLLGKLMESFGRIKLVFADSGYAGKLVDWALEKLNLKLQIVKRTDKHSFQVLPRRWVVERSLAWIIGHRRCARDYERLPEHHESMVRWTAIRLLSRRLARHHQDQKS